MDISSLYTNIPNMEGVQAVRYFLTKKPPNIPTEYITRGLEMVLTNNFFKFETGHFQQIAGTAMGSAVAPAFANLFMGWLEEDHVTFLDVALDKDREGHIKTGLFTKPTDRNALLRYESAHPRHLIDNLPISQFLRVLRIHSDTTTIETQMEAMHKKFRDRGYPEDVLTVAREKAHRSPVGKADNGDAISSTARYLFPCNVNGNIRSQVTPASAHALSPSDIKVVSTLRSLKLNPGDGGSESEFARMEETLQRASQLTESYVGQRLYYSISNISPVPQNNLMEEAKELVKTLRQSLVVSFADDWKMVLIFVAAEDPCNFCIQEDYTERAMAELRQALDYLQQQMPKTFVSVVDLTPLSGLYLSHTSNSDIRKSCECFRKPSDYYKAMLRFSFQSALERLVSSGRYDTKEDFTVALHPVVRMVDSETKNMNNYGEVYEVQCSAQDTPFLNTHRNSPYLWLKDMMRVDQSKAQALPEIGRLEAINMFSLLVHQLKAADFKIVAALGDSITAGNGAGAFVLDLLDVVTEYRGISWSIGGDGDLSNTTTIANILRKYNPDLQGYSLGKASHHLKKSMLNRAVPGAKADDMLEQSENLVKALKRMNMTGKINYAEDWKLLTIFIGGNDLCGICKNPIYHSPEQFVYRIKQALDYLQQEVPRMFVNLVTILDIIPLKQLYDDERTHCPRRIMSSLCGCVVDYADHEVQIATLKTFNKQYQEKTRQLVETGLYDTTEDFAVVIQPFLEHLVIPQNPDGVPDRSYMAPDCFHFGEKAHSQSALALWKNMFEPVGQKTIDQPLNQDIGVVCPPKDDPYVKTAKNSNYVYPTVTPDLVLGSKLDCTDRSKSPTIPTSVHQLRPADITVVAAVGDSLTAGNGIGSNPNDVLDVIRQYRGLSWSIGGDSTLDHVTTLPNILLEFNPFVTGYATETGNKEAHSAFYNKAVPGAKAFDMPTQVRALIDHMKTDKRIRFNEDWKVVTMFIGANDLCASCTDSNVFSAVSYVNHIREALDMLHKEVPRAFVNLVEVLDIIPLREGVLDKRVKCPALLTKMLCPCLLNILDNTGELEGIKNVNLAYQFLQQWSLHSNVTHFYAVGSSVKVLIHSGHAISVGINQDNWTCCVLFLKEKNTNSLQTLIDTGRYDTKDDFTVVLQPFFRHTKIPYLPSGAPDVSYLAPDCFHISQKGHSQLARLLWNNMLEPLGQKTETMDFTANVPLKCPTQTQPYLRTYKNSNYNYPPPPPTPPPITNWGSDLHCSIMGPSNSVPTSVHQLRPADIKVVAALGDSLTAAFGARATSILNVATEWRGVSWSIGGDETLDTVTTLPNILKKFNSNLKGFSTGVGKDNLMFNVAISGAKAENMSSQAQTLVQKMKESSSINFDQDWKLITLFIGGNDLCQFCQNRDRYSLENHINHIEHALEIIYKEIPRVFVNLVEIMLVEGLRTVVSDTIGCALLRPGLCPCFINPRDGSPELNEINKFNRDLQTRLSELPEKFQGREDFAAVVQPFLKNTIVPMDHNGKPDVNFFAEDCFHFDERGQAEMAIALWNNMLEPVGQKQTFNNFTHDRTKLKCPTQDHPYLFTLKNSGLPTNKPPVDKPEDPEDPEDPEKSDDQVPYWSVIVASIGGVALGCVVVGVAMSVTYKKKAQKKSTF
ncbi:phospholipase B1, membrane-associated [Gastrophryne carolinensis]